MAAIEGKNFLEHIIDKDLADGVYDKVVTRFPPEPNGYLHIGHAKAIFANYGITEKYNGQFNLRMDDTDPSKEKPEYAEAMIEDIKWLGADFGDRVFYASSYFDQMYDCAIELIKKGKAYVCDLTQEQMREYRGSLTEAGKNSPYRERSIEENLDLFERMKSGEFPDGMRILRAKIDMASPNMNMRDPGIYRIAHLHHYASGDKWCVYPLYDYAHPIEDAIEGVTHSMCGLEFEDHRPLYNWVLEALEWPKAPKQVEFAEIKLTKTVIGKRKIRPLVESGVIDGWDDPRMMTIRGMKRRGYTKEAIRNFFEMIGLSRSKSTVDIAMLEHALREDLKLKTNRLHAILKPLKITITNYPEGQTETLEVENNSENLELGTRMMTFGRELYIEADDFMEVPIPKYKRLYLGGEVRLMHAYFIKCEEVVKDSEGNIIELLCTYDQATKSGSGFKDRKPNGTIHWIEATTSVDAEVRMFDYLFNEDEEGNPVYNEDSKVIYPGCKIEPEIKQYQKEDKFQFVRHGYFCIDSKDTTSDHLVVNLTIGLKTSYK